MIYRFYTETEILSTYYYSSLRYLSGLSASDFPAVLRTFG